LIAKVIPDTQQFLLKGLELSELLDWTPTGATPIEEILYKFDQGPEFTLRLRRILEANSRRGRYVQYRALQAFHDRWASQPDRKCFGEFLKILIGRFAEEPMDVEFETEGVIELSQNPSVVAPAPRHYGTVEVPELNASIQWMRELDFARLRISGNVSETEWHGKRGLPREIVIADAAPPEHVLTVDLASEFAHSIRVFSGPRFADETISLVWSVVKADSEDEDLLLSPWPMLDEPKSPTTWKERFDEWSEHIKAVLTPDGKVTADTLLEAWFRFNVQDPGSESTGPPAGRTLATRLKNTIQRASSERRDRARNVLAPLAAAVFALPKWCRNAVKGATMTSRDARRVEETAGRRVLSWNRSKHDPYELAMWPSYPYSRANVESVEALIRRYPISKLFR
jgi:hypothetical protein